MLKSEWEQAQQLIEQITKKAIEEALEKIMGKIEKLDSELHALKAGMNKKEPVIKK